MATTHGMSKTRAYNAWLHMQDRCSNPENKRFPRYGGRGISVCERWATFEMFYADMGECPAGYSIERKDNDSGYAPENCCWLPRGEQSKNRSGNRYIEIDGEMVCAAEASRRLGIKHNTLLWRMSHGFKRGSVTSWVGKGARITHQGETLNIHEWANKLGISAWTIASRRRRGWSVERMLGPVQ